MLVNAHDVVEWLSENGPATPAELAVRLDMPRSSVYRLVDGLTSISLTRTDADGRVHVGERWLRLADAAQASMTEWSGMREVLVRLAKHTGQTAFLSVPQPDGALCIDWSQGRGIDVLALKPGRSLPFNAGAAGRIAFAYADESAQAEAASQPLRSFTPQTITTIERLMADAARVREAGWVHSDEDVTLGIGSVGIPVLGQDNALIGCASLAGLAGEIRELRDVLVAQLRAGVASWSSKR